MTLHPRYFSIMLRFKISKETIFGSSLPKVLVDILVEMMFRSKETSYERSSSIVKPWTGRYSLHEHCTLVGEAEQGGISHYGSKGRTLYSLAWTQSGYCDTGSALYDQSQNAPVLKTQKKTVTEWNGAVKKKSSKLFINILFWKCRTSMTSLVFWSIPDPATEHSYAARIIVNQSYTLHSL